MHTLLYNGLERVERMENGHGQMIQKHSVKN